MAEQVVRLKDRLNQGRNGEGRLDRVMSRTAANRAAMQEREALSQLDGGTNKRKAPRKQSAMPAFLKIDGRHRIINCKIMDMSATGACLKVLRTDKHINEDILRFPDYVTLFITFDKVSVDCQIAWRLEDKSQIGVRFLSPAKSYS